MSVFCDWLGSLGIMSSRFIHVAGHVVCQNLFFKCQLSAIPLCGHPTVCVSIQLLMDIRMVSIFCLRQITLQGMWCAGTCLSPTSNALGYMSRRGIAGSYDNSV